MLKKIYASLMLIGIFSSLAFAQNIKSSKVSESTNLPKFIVATNVVAPLGGNISINLSLEKPINEKRGVELDLDYYLWYFKENKNQPINYLNTKTKGGFSALISYKFLSNPEKTIQLILGPSLGYRHIQYAHEQAVCTEVIESPSTAICECANLVQNHFTSQSRSVIGGVNIGFQNNYTTSKGRFFFKLHGTIGGAQFFPKVDGRLNNVACPNFESVVEQRQNSDIIRLREKVHGNYTVQFEKKFTSYLALNIKLGYAF